MSRFTDVFKNVLHGLEAASVVAAPIVGVFAPEIAPLMMGAFKAAVGVEAAVTTSGSGDQKAAIVQQSIKTSIDTANDVLTSTGAKPLPADAEAAIVQQVPVFVAMMNALADSIRAQQSKSANNTGVVGGMVGASPVPATK